MKPIEPHSQNAGRPLRVSIVAFPECDPSIMYGIFDTLWIAGANWKSSSNEPTSEVMFAPRLVAAEPGPLRLITGVTIMPQETIDDIEETDYVLVPNVLVDTPETIRALDRRLLNWIVEMHRRGARLLAACGGSIVLAEAGLLEGQSATTHWMYAPLFRSQFPNVELKEERILVQAGAGHSIVCAGGASSWQDLTLFLIARHAGTAEAIRISKIFLYQWHRDGQLPYASMIANADHGDAAVKKCQEYAPLHYQSADIVAELLRLSGLPKRSFDRRFRKATGYSPLEYVQWLRVEEAKQMLEMEDGPIEEIALEVGYSDLASFRRLFRKLAGLTPGEYRRRFRLPANVEAALQAVAPAARP
ncbi:helix-turn-helix domain-containing protein [Rhizobium indicum]|uniref:GlxA family transcriptional regulator n=1 Tax=Rhizobium TaxID=379 RepID=UPI001106ADF9|nr:MULTISPECIES: helix-turn-helix domain-containing protein [Rhizobium]MBA1347836.1 helix-turn-helix domain-containing protein [Rhizobium sp. WYCCWR 11146]QKK29584.1 helix-turn-helix domain-containing protein [Rhizobium indicum]